MQGTWKLVNAECTEHWGTQSIVNTGSAGNATVSVLNTVELLGMHSGYRLCRV